MHRTAPTTDLISLSTASAESSTKSQRAAVLNQRMTEAKGGEAGQALGNTLFLVGVLSAYTTAQRYGYSLTPVSPAKALTFASILGAGVLAKSFGSQYGMTTLGNKEQYYYLLGNRSAIIRGDLPMDKPASE